MDDLLSTLLSFPPHPSPPIALSDSQYDAGIKAQVENVRKVPLQSLLQTTSSGEHLLNLIDPSVNTIPYIFVLLANISASEFQGLNTINAEVLWQKIVLLLERSDPRQIRYVGKEYVQIIAAAANFAHRTHQINIAVTPIAQAILRLDEAGSTFTSTHLLLVRLAVESRAYSQATKVLDRSILFFPGMTHQSNPQYICSRSLSAPSYITPESGFTDKIKYQDVLEYFLLGGTAYIGLKQWEKALNLLESAVIFPVKESGVSKIMVDAYKKWMLVHLLVKGRAASLPHTTNSTVAKFFHVLAKPYDIVASLFETASASRLLAEVNISHEIWNEDSNLGLVLFVLASYQKFQIRNLAKAYRTIPISKVTKMTMSAETGKNLPSNQATETLITQMIAEGELDATVSYPTDDLAILTFNPNLSVLPETDVQLQLNDLLSRIKSLKETVKLTDRRLTYEKEYLKWAYKQKRLDRSGIGDSMPGEDIVWSPTDEEDLMSGGF